MIFYVFENLTQQENRKYDRNKVMQELIYIYASVTKV